MYRCIYASMHLSIYLSICRMYAAARSAAEDASIYIYIHMYVYIYIYIYGHCYCSYQLTLLDPFHIRCLWNRLVTSGHHLNLGTPCKVRMCAVPHVSTVPAIPHVHNALCQTFFQKPWTLFWSPIGFVWELRTNVHPSSKTCCNCWMLPKTCSIIQYHICFAVKNGSWEGGHVGKKHLRQACSAVDRASGYQHT